jgi:hypothetical protein
MPAMILTEQEVAYVRRFCYEVWHRIDGPDTTINQCRGHYYDLADLATWSGIRYEVIKAAEESGDQEPLPRWFPSRGSLWMPWGIGSRRCNHPNSFIERLANPWILAAAMPGIPGDRPGVAQWLPR